MCSYIAGIPPLLFTTLAHDTKILSIRESCIFRSIVPRPGSTCSCALFPHPLHSLPLSLLPPPPPSLFLSLSRFLSFSLSLLSSALSRSLSLSLFHAHPHTSLHLSTSFRLLCVLITLFVFNKEFLISCFSLHVCERVCMRARAACVRACVRAGGRAGGRAGVCA